MSIAALLARAKAQVAEAPAADEPFPAGAWVELVIAGSTFGRVDFVEDGWVHWTATDGGEHASRPDVLRRRT